MLIIKLAFIHRSHIRLDDPCPALRLRAIVSGSFPYYYSELPWDDLIDLALESDR